MSNNGQLNFDDLTPHEEKVSIGGKEYILREASGDAVCKWRNALLKSTRLGPEGRPQVIDGMADTEPYLVSLCMFEPYDLRGERRERPVPVQQIRSWPNRIQKALFDRVQAISHLSDDGTTESVSQRIETLEKELSELRSRKEEDELGKSQGATTGGSV